MRCTERWRFNMKCHVFWTLNMQWNWKIWAHRQMSAEIHKLFDSNWHWFFFKVEKLEDRDTKTVRRHQHIKRRAKKIDNYHRICWHLLIFTLWYRLQAHSLEIDFVTNALVCLSFSLSSSRSLEGIRLMKRSNLPITIMELSHTQRQWMSECKRTAQRTGHTRGNKYREVNCCSIQN